MQALITLIVTAWTMLAVGLAAYVVLHRHEHRRPR